MVSLGGSGPFSAGSLNGQATGGGTLTQGTSATFNFGGASIAPALTATASPNTVNYNGGVQTALATTYHHLTLYLMPHFKVHPRSQP